MLLLFTYKYIQLSVLSLLSVQLQLTLDFQLRLISKVVGLKQLISIYLVNPSEKMEGGPRDQGKDTGCISLGSSLKGYKGSIRWEEKLSHKRAQWSRKCNNKGGEPLWMRQEEG